MIDDKKSYSGVDKNPLGYKYLRTWQQANEIFALTEEYVATLPRKHPKTGQFLSDVADHMLRSARSEVRNIEEGYRRTTTNQYVDFLGFSAGSNEELLGDFEYCIRAEIVDLELAKKGSWLCRGEGKMLANQIRALNKKMENEKTLSRNETARRALISNTEEQKRQDKWVKALNEKYNKGKYGN